MQRFDQFLQQELRARVRGVLEAVDDGCSKFGFAEFDHRGCPGGMTRREGISLHRRTVLRRHKRLDQGMVFGYQTRSPPIPETRPMLAPTSASPETAGMSSAALARADQHLEAALSMPGDIPARSSCLPPWQDRALFRTGLCRSRTQGARQGRHHLPHLFHDQADHLGRLHDAGGGRPRRDRRSRPQVHSGVEKSRRSSPAAIRPT